MALSMAIDVTCPECGTRDIRTSRSSNLREWLLEFAGIYNLVCKRCETRFRDSIWKPGLLRYASCPRCMRTELSRWDESRYNPPFSTIFWLRLGAKPYRCEFCRCNFASFRARKQRYDPSRHRRPRTPESAAGEPGQSAVRQ